ncbi:hypothetical protein BDQ17DRAFT_1424627 [Cyathus striatus]|nr:hypothetical protein BDQ17DRAFT_1424627 [Cyathus striatus]
MDMECPVCFDECAEKQVIATPCGHLYCQECLDASIKDLEEREKFQSERADYIMMHEGEQVRQLRQEINDAKQEGDRWRARYAADAAGPSDANPDRKKTITSAGTGKDSARVTAARPRTRTCSARRKKSKQSPSWTERRILDQED